MSFACPPPPDFFDSAAAAAEWGLCAPVVAGRPAMRVLVRRGGQAMYPASTQRPLTATPPNAPAAVMLFDGHGRLSTLGLDFDVSRLGRDQVQHDAAEALQLLSEAGLLPWADAAATGGRHVYARLPHPVPTAEISRLAAALAARWPTLDVSPLLNTTGGCLRPPGAAHKTAGYQRLVSPLEYVRRAVAHTPPPHAWQALWSLTGANHVEVLPARTDAPLTPAPVPGVARRPLASRWETIARGGKHPYRSESEARMAVVGGCVRAGWSLADLEAAITGPWAAGPMALRLHRKYGRSWRQRLGAEFTKARNNHFEYRVARSVRKPDTRPGTTRGVPSPTMLSVGNPHLELRKFASFATDYARRNRLTVGQRAVLRAMIWAGLVQGRVIINTGCRALAEQANYCHQHVCDVLKELADHDLVQFVREHDGPHAALWRINTALGAEHRPMKGPIRGVHRVFRVIGGHRTGEVWEALRRSPTPLSADALGTLLGYERQRMSEDLRLLAGWELARRTPTGWVLGDADADQLSASLGGEAHWQAQHDRHVAHRAAWHRVLLQRGQHVPLAGQLNWDDLLAIVNPQDDWIQEFAAGSPPPGVHERPAQQANTVA